MRDLNHREWHVPGCVRLSRPEWLLAALLLLCYTYFFPRFADWNQNSRLALVFAIVHEGRLEIDTYAASTGDFAELNGHRYSDKAPGPALLGVPVYAAVRPFLESPVVSPAIERLSRSEALVSTLKLTEAPLDKVNWAIAQIVVTWVVVTGPSIVLMLVTYRLLGRLRVSDPRRIVVVVAYALGTSAFPYSANYYSHQLTAALLFISFALLWKANRAGPGRLISVGLMLGTALISEYSTALIIAALGLYAITIVRDKLSIGWAILGGILPLMVMAIYDLAIFGTPLPIGYSYSTLWQEEHQTGFFSLVYPTPGALWGISFGTYRGLFFSAPILLVGVIGLAPFSQRKDLRAEWMVCTWSILSFFLFNSASVMWTGGFGVGPRYLVPMLPFLVLPIAFALEAWGGSARFRAAFAAALIWSIVVTWSLSIATQSFPTFVNNPLWSLSLPALAAGDVARNWGTLLGLKGIWSLAPLALLVGLLSICLIRESTRGTMATATARTDAGPCDGTDHSPSVQAGSPYPSPGWIDRVADRGVGSHRVRPPMA